MTDNKQLNTPIAFIIFNRPDTTQRVFDEIRKVQPKQLFIIADGARNNEEWKECNKTRKIIDQVDWDCKIHKNYSNKNLGCKIRVSSGLDWFFENVEEGIILEDDCLPHQDFFRYCEELLEKYRNNDKIMCISGDNFQDEIKRGNASYYFSIHNHCWGWATWRRSWKYFDVKMKTFPEFFKKNKIKKILNQKIAQKYWLKIFQATFENKINSWAYVWTYTCWNQGGLTCLPNVNLVSNIGFDERGTHTTSKDDKNANISTKNLIFPLYHPKKILANKKADNYSNKYVFGINRKKEIFKKINLFLKNILKKIKLFNHIKYLYLKYKKTMIKFIKKLKNPKRKTRQLFLRVIRSRLFYFLIKHKYPLSNIYGMDRGKAIDRYYIKNFLNDNKKYIKGNCLEILNNNYTIKYGGEKVVKSDVLDIDLNNKKASIIDDLRKLEKVSNNTYDCIILTQVLQYINNYESAIKECCRILKPKGILLVTLPSICRIDCVAGINNDFWRFTTASAKYIFSKYFSQKNLAVKAYGNCLVGLSFWAGLAQEELSKKELDFFDENFPCLITVRVIK